MRGWRSLRFPRAEMEGLLRFFLSLAVAAVVFAGGGTAAAGQPAPSAQGWIAFASDRDGDFELYVMRADGSELRQLTRNTTFDGFPAWSPDGRAVAFASDRSGDLELYVMDADGGPARRLTHSPGRDADASWSPDGSRLVFESERDGDRDVYAMDADGSDVVRLTENPEVDGDPAWSPDGTLIAFGSERDEEYHVFLMRPDGTEVGELTGAGYDQDPAWSPDGAWVAFESAPSELGPWDIWLVAADGSGERRLTDHPADDELPAWSPDGRSLLVVSERDGARSLYTLGTDGSGLRRLTEGALSDAPDDSAPAWHGSPVFDGCTQAGTPGPDRLVGTSAADILCGGGGDDVLEGRGGRDVLRGGSGADVLVGGPGADRLDGGPGRDCAVSGPGPDAMTRVEAVVRSAGACPAVRVPATVRASRAPAGEVGWRRAARLPRARSEVAGAFYAGTIAVAGGFLANGSSSSRVDLYDPALNRWTGLPDLPVAVNHAMAAGGGSRLYVVGGYADGTPQRRAVAWDGERWRRLPPLPEPRAAAGAALAGGLLYVVGGVGEGRRLAREAFVYDPVERRWSRIPGPEPREHLGVAALGGRVYAAGGRTGGFDTNVDVFEVYRPGERRWVSLPRVPTARGGTALAAVAGLLVSAGGEEVGGTIASVFAYDRAARRWARLADMETPRHGLALAGAGRRLFAIAGGPEPGLTVSGANEWLPIP